MSISKIARPFALAAALTLGLSVAAVAQTSTAPQTNTIVPLGHAGNRSGVQDEHPAKIIPYGHAGNRSDVKNEHPANVIPFGHAGNRSVQLPQQ